MLLPQQTYFQRIFDYLRSLLALPIYRPAVFPLIAAVSAVLTALSRVVAGVHFPRDVIAGAAFGIGFSVLCFSVLPF